MQLFEFAVAVIFLLSLVAVSRFRRYLSAEDKGSYNHVVIGLAVLAVASLAQVYNGLGMFGRVPFLSEQPFFKLVFWIGMITGLAFLMDGVTNWVPLSRSYRKYNKDRIEKLDLIKKMEQLVRVENRVPVIFETALRYMVSGYNLDGGAAYILSRTKGTAVCAGLIDPNGRVSGEIRPVSVDKLPVFRSNRQSEPEPDKFKEGLPTNMDVPDQVVPVWAGKHLAGLFVFWTKSSASLSSDDRMNLKISGDIIGHEVCCDLLQMQHDVHEDVNQWRELLISQLDYDSEPRTNIVAVVETLREKIAVDYFGLTIVYGENHAQRYTIGETGGLLAETNIDLGKSPSLTNSVYSEGQTIYVDDLEEEPDLPVDDVIRRSGYNSLAVFPVRHGAAAEAVVTIATRTSAPPRGRRLAYLQATVGVLGNVVAIAKHQHQLKALRRRGFAINNLLSEIAQGEPIQNMFQKAVSMIRSEIKPTVVRLSVLDGEGSFLNSKALELLRSDTTFTPEKGAMILSLMPYHQLVLDTGRLMMINQERTDRRMTEAEEKQVFGASVNSALLVPVKVGSSTIGLISLGETRDWSRFQFRQTDIQFVTAVAAALSIAVRLEQKQPSRVRIKQENASAPGDADSEGRGRIRSSLSGIIGSVELLKANKQPTGENLDRCLSIIDKSARKISEYISDKTD